VFAGKEGGARGGGVLVQGGVASLFQATFVENVSDNGAGLAATSGATVSIRNTVFAGNVAVEASPVVSVVVVGEPLDVRGGRPGAGRRHCDSAGRR
jgi:hypothetical protein